jgi:serine/threonine protein kinase
MVQLGKHFELDEKNIIFESKNSRIFTGTHLPSNTPVLMKTPSHKYPRPNTIESFKKEFQYGSFFHQKHPEDFVKMVECLETSNSVFLISERQGSSISEIIKRNGKFSYEDFLENAIEMTKNLLKIHNLNFIHRDVKSSNFVLNLIDFGISAPVYNKTPLIHCPTPVGTYQYMSPESCGLGTYSPTEQTGISKYVGRGSDIYSLGITFFEMLTGYLPFNGDSKSIMHQQRTKNLPTPNYIPWEMNCIIQKMTEKDTKNRYFSLVGVLNDLKFCLENIKNPGNLENFIAGKKDVKGFQISMKFYGREKELDTMKNWINSKKKNIMLVSGYSGCGKTKLITNFVSDSDLKFITGKGKCEQFQNSIPYYPFIK